MSGSAEHVDATTRPKASVRDAALKVADELHKAGFQSLFAGGCVRDKLLGVEPAEYDVATDARPEQVEQVFRKVQKVGESFGVMLVRLLGHTIEVATFRTDGVYSDGRHPDDVTFSDAEHDARRRDFTINGMFEDPRTGEVVDYVGGRADLANRMIRAIGDPAARLREDHLRMLRAVRFAARLGFEIEEQTAEAIRAAAGDLRGVSRERIGQEIKKMLTHVNRAVAAWEVQYLGLDPAVLEEPHCDEAPQRVGKLIDGVAYATILAAWLLDRHPAEPEYWPRLADRWCGALMLSNDEHEGMKGALSAYRTLMNEWDRLGVARQKRLAASQPFEAGLALVLATDNDRFIQIKRRVEQLEKTGLAPVPLINGDDLIEAGLEPGPLFGRLLDSIYDAQLEDTIHSREEALSMARALQWTLETGVRRPGE